MNSELNKVYCHLQIIFSLLIKFALNGGFNFSAVNVNHDFKDDFGGQCRRVWIMNTVVERSLFQYGTAPFLYLIFMCWA